MQSLTLHATTLSADNPQIETGKLSLRRSSQIQTRGCT